MEDNNATNSKQDSWDLMLWLWVIAGIAAIYSTIPVARSAQKSIYAHFGPEFFTYLVITTIVACLLIICYLLITKLEVRNNSQYIWLIICGSILIYYALSLRKHPEEAVHIIEYGGLSFLVFRALSHRIRDWTVYAATILIVSLAGTVDELIQWIIPSRVGDYKDVQLNAISGFIGVLIISMGIRPKNIDQPVSKYSLKFLTTITIITVIVIGLSLLLFLSA